VIDGSVSALFTSVYDFIESELVPSLSRPQFTVSLGEYRAGRAETVYAYVDTLPALTCAAAGGSTDKAIPLAAAWVFYLLASQLFDDLQDGDGQDRPWGRGSAQATLSMGLFALGAAETALSHLGADANTLSEILAAFGKTMALAAGAQSQTIALAELTVDKYFRILAAKAGLIFATGTWSGTRLAGTAADPDVLNAIYQYGLNVGIAGQIADDCFDLGRGDLTSHVFTLPVIYALSQKQHPAYPTLVKLLGARANETADWAAEVFDILHEFGAVAWSLQVARVYSEQALAALAPLPEERVRPLVAYATRKPDSDH
jgi:geranylgeranyl pyrophosphate synthase